MINLGLIMGTVGGAVGIILGILIFSAIGGNVPCPGDVGDINDAGTAITSANSATAGTAELNQGKTECANAKSIAWTVLGILPITLFFGLFALFGSRQ